jgi:hypothetical protein
MHVPGATLLWSNLADAQVVVEWQSSQLAVVLMCCAGFPDAKVPL